MSAMKRRLTVVNEGLSSCMDVDVNPPTENGEDEWKCEYALHWPDGTKDGAAYGIDAVQALTLALNIVAAHLYTSDFHKEKRLFWESLGNGYGFPLPANIRDLGEGADRLL